MSYLWHSQRQSNSDAMRLTWIIIKTKNERVNEKEKYKKCNFWLNQVTMIEKENTYTGVSLHSHSLMKLFSPLSYIKKKIKNYIKRKIKI